LGNIGAQPISILVGNNVNNVS